MGHTLPELLITLTLIAILSLLTLPTYQTFLTNTQDQTTRDQLLRAISLSKSEAQLRDDTITLTLKPDKIFLTSTQQVIYNFNKKEKINWRGSLNRPELQIHPDGTTHGEEGTFWYCDTKQKPHWAIVINQMARARIVTTDELTTLHLSCA